MTPPVPNVVPVDPAPAQTAPPIESEAGERPLDLFPSLLLSFVISETETPEETLPPETEAPPEVLTEDAPPPEVLTEDAPPPEVLTEDAPPPEVLTEDAPPPEESAEIPSNAIEEPVLDLGERVPVSSLDETLAPAEPRAGVQEAEPRSGSGREAKPLAGVDARTATLESGTETRPAPSLAREADGSFPVKGTGSVAESSDAELQTETHSRPEPRAAQGEDGTGPGARPLHPAPAGGTEFESQLSAPASRSDGSAPVQTRSATRALPELTAPNENAVVQGARVLVRDGGGTARVLLFPPELGGIDIRVTVNQNVVQVSFVADRAAIADLLMHHLPELRQALQTQGMVVDRAQVAHRDAGDPGAERNGASDEGSRGQEPGSEQGNRSEHRGSEPGLAGRTLEELVAGLPAKAALSRLSSLGAIDVRA